MNNEQGGSLDLIDPRTAEVTYIPVPTPPEQWKQAISQLPWEDQRIIFCTIRKLLSESDARVTIESSEISALNALNALKQVVGDVFKLRKLRSGPDLVIVCIKDENSKAILRAVLALDHNRAVQAGVPLQQAEARSEPEWKGDKTRLEYWLDMLADHAIIESYRILQKAGTLSKTELIFGSRAFDLNRKGGMRNSEVVAGIVEVLVRIGREHGYRRPGASFELTRGGFKIVLDGRVVIETTVQALENVAYFRRIELKRDEREQRAGDMGGEPQTPQVEMQGKERGDGAPEPRQYTKKLPSAQVAAIESGHDDKEIKPEDERFKPVAEVVVDFFGQTLSQITSLDDEESCCILFESMAVLEERLIEYARRREVQPWVLGLIESFGVENLINSVLGRDWKGDYYVGMEMIDGAIVIKGNLSLYNAKSIIESLKEELRVGLYLQWGKDEMSIQADCQLEMDQRIKVIRALLFFLENLGDAVTDTRVSSEDLVRTDDELIDLVQKYGVLNLLLMALGLRDTEVLFRDYGIRYNTSGHCIWVPKSAKNKIKEVLKNLEESV